MTDESDASEYKPAFEPPSPDELAILLPQYEIQRFIAQGGMGAVYLARQPTLDRFVAIKVLPPNLGGELDFTARFQTEARAMAKLQHSNIVSVYDFGVTAQGHLYLVMEYVHGQTLHDFIQAGALTLPHVLSYTLQLCDALQYAHEHGIIHRDIKPANVLINEDGRVKVADFGLARPAAAHDQEVMMGTPEYAAPEISQGLKVDQRADIYALGVLVYEMLTGTTPEQGRKAASVLAGVDPGWDDLISKATKANVLDRFQSVKDLRAMAMLVASRRRYAPGAQPPARAVQTKGGGATKALMVCLLLGAVAVGGYLMWQKGKQETPAPKEETKAQVASQADAPPHSSPEPVEANKKDIAEDKPKPGEPPPEPLHIDFEKADSGYLGRFPLGHKDVIWSVVLLPDRQRVVSAGADHLLKIWRTLTGELLHTLRVPAGINSMAVSGDGKYAAVGCDDNHIRVYDLETWEMKGAAQAPGKMTFGIAFSADNRQVIGAGNSATPNRVEIWSWQEKAEPKLLEGWSYPVNGMCLVPGAPEGRFATVGGMPKTSPDAPVQAELCIGSLDSTTPLRVMAPLKGIPWRVAVSQDQKYVAVMVGNVATIYDFQSQKELARCLGHGNRIDTLRFLDGGRLLLTGCEDRTMRIWESATGKELWRVTLDNAHATSAVAVSADETLAVSGGGLAAGQAGQAPEKDGDNHLHLWKLPPLDTLHSGGALASANDDLNNLAAIDPELAKLKSEVESEWDGKIAKAVEAERKDLDARYITYLQKSLPTATPSERSAFLDEISRVSNSGPVPDAPPTSAPPALQRLIKVYIDQVGVIKQKFADLSRIILQSEESRFTTLQTLRKTQGDNKGASRAARLWQQWVKTHGQQDRA